MTRYRSVFRFILLAVFCVSAFPAGNALAEHHPLKHVIVMIGDGNGFNQMAAGSIYDKGTTGTFAQNGFPFAAAMSTYPGGSGYDPQRAWGDFDYPKGKSGADALTDSAAAATAMSTGKKTYTGAIGFIGTKKEAVRGKNVIEYAEEAGLSTGVVTTVQWSHATPAGFVAHNKSRGKYEEIAEEMLTQSAVDVIMGCGNPLYDESGEAASARDYKFVGGQAVWNGLTYGSLNVADADHDGKPDPWKLIQTRREFQQLAESANPPRRVIGMPVVHSTLQLNRAGKKDADPYAVPLNQNVPTLGEMSRGALNVLAQNPKGFFLMIEGGAIDWAQGNGSRLIEEELGFAQAVQAVFDWVNSRSNWNETILIVTADHETGYLWGPGSGAGGKPVWKPLVNNGARRVPGMEWCAKSHSNSLVPFFAKGPQWALLGLAEAASKRDPIRGAYLDNTDMGKFCIQAVRSVAAPEK